jgi:hypothetical protein
MESRESSFAKFMVQFGALLAVIFFFFLLFFIGRYFSNTISLLGLNFRIEPYGKVLIW